MTFEEELKESYEEINKVKEAIKIIEICMMESFTSSRLRFKGLK